MAMEFEETHRVGSLGFDEKTETWFVQPAESHRLMLTRQSLARLVQMYNSIHRGSTLALVEQREVRRWEEVRRRHSEALRNLEIVRLRNRPGIRPSLPERLASLAARLASVAVRLFAGAAHLTAPALRRRPRP